MIYSSKDKKQSNSFHQVNTYEIKGSTDMAEDKIAYFVHESSYVDEGACVGEGTKIWHFSHVMPGAKIGKNCSFGQNVNIGSDVSIGNNVKIQNNVSVHAPCSEAIGRWYESKCL